MLTDFFVKPVKCILILTTLIRFNSTSDAFRLRWVELETLFFQFRK